MNNQSFATLLKFDADGGAPSGGAGGQTPEDPKGGQPDTVAKADYDKVVSANNWAQSQVKSLKSTVEELQAQVSEFQAQAKTEEPKIDVDALLAKNKDLEEALNTERSRATKAKIRDTVRKEIEPHLAPNTWDYYWNAQKDNFVLAEVEGKETVQYAPAPYLTYDQILEQLPPAMKASTKAAGAGVVNTAPASSDSISVSQYQRMDRADRVKFLRENPGVLQAALKKGFS